MRRFALLALALPLGAQTSPIRIAVPAGNTEQLALQISNAPLAGDTIYFQVSSKSLSIVLIAPSGARITKETAQKSGFDWGEMGCPPPIGSTDAGAIGSIDFLQDGVAGKYVLEFSAPSGAQNAWAAAEFGTEKELYSSLMSRVPGFQKVGTSRLDPGRKALEINLDRDEKQAIFDVLTDPGGQISLTLPNGETISDTSGKRDGVSWTTGTRDMFGPSDDEMFSIGGFLLPDVGTHHVAVFENAQKGKYKVRAVGEPANVTAAFIPLQRLLEGGTEESTKPNHVGSGRTKVELYGLPSSDAKVGDNVEVTVRISGRSLSELSFLVHMEYRQIVSRDPLSYSAPIVDEVPTVFTPKARGLYSGVVIPRRPGTLRFGVQVSGRLGNGKVFSAEAWPMTMYVEAVAARFLGLEQKAIDEDRNGTLDRLEVTAKLDVVIPGEYAMRAEISGPHSRAYTTTTVDNDEQLKVKTEVAHDPYGGGALLDTQKMLAPGTQTLTATLSAKQIRANLSDGEWVIRAPIIFRVNGNAAAEGVVIPPQAALKINGRVDDWDRGEAYVERNITLRGIRPAASGRFRFLEVLWDVTTPGTTCRWHGAIRSSDRIVADQFLSGELPAGRSQVSFVYDAALFTADPKRVWTLGPWLDCLPLNVQEEQPLFIKLPVNPAEYEPRKEPFLFTAEMARLSPSVTYNNVDLVAIGRAKEAIVFRLAGQAPPGLTVKFPRKPEARDNDMVEHISLTATSVLQPGRYFVPMEAQAADGTATTEMVVDVLK